MDTEQAHHPEQVPPAGISVSRLAARACGAVALALGLLVLVGWFTGQRRLIQVSPDFVPMQFNTALGFLLCGAGLLLGAFPRLRGAVAGIVFALGAATLAQYVFGVDLGLDELFKEHEVTVKTSHPGRMAPNTALCFTLMGLVLGALTLRLPSSTTAVLGSLVASLGLLAFIGYVAQIETAYGWGHLTRMAVHTSAGFLVLGGGVLAATVARRPLGHDGDGKSSSRSRRDPGPFPAWTPVPVLAFGCVLSVGLWQALDDRDRLRIGAELETRAVVLASDLRDHVETRLDAFDRMAERWMAEGGTPRERWEDDARRYLEHHAGLQAVEWVDPDMIVRWVVPREGNEAAVGLDLSTDAARREALMESVRTRSVGLSPPVELVQGGRGFLSFHPLHMGETFDGFILSVHRYGPLIEAWLEDNALWLAASGTGGALTLDVRQDGDLVHATGAPPTGRVRTSRRPLRLHGTTWTLELAPDAEWVSARASFVPLMTLFIGLAMSALVAALAHLWRSAVVRQRAAAAAARRIRVEVQERRRAQLQLTRANESLQSSNDELERFAYVASHDLQEPLRMVAGFVDLLEHRYSEAFDDRGREYVRFASEGARRMSDMIRALLEYSRVGREPAPAVAVPLRGALDEALENLAGAVREADATVVVNDLPTVRGRRPDLVRVFQNLVGNALKHRSEAPPVIEVGAEWQGDRWVVHVRDNGPGFRPEDAERIFDVFQRLVRWEDCEGSGIGLSIVRKVVESLDGEVWAESRAEGGATFFVALPDAEARGAERSGSDATRADEPRADEPRRRASEGVPDPVAGT